jgi:hypothetical protein
VTDISRLALIHSSNAAARNYTAFSFAGTKIHDIPDNIANPYDPINLVNRLLALGAEGQTLICWDTAKDTYYVAQLEKRRPPQFQDVADKADFSQDYQIVTMQAFAPPKDPSQPKIGPLWETWFLPKHRADYRKDLMRRLREEAGGGPTSVNEQGQLILSEAAQKQQQAQGPAPIQSDESEGGD